MIRVSRKDYFNSMVFTQSLQGLRQRIVNISFKVFVHSCIFAINSRNEFVKQYKFIFWYSIDCFISILTSFQKMRNDHIMGIVIFVVFNQSFKESEVVIVNIKIDRSHASQCICKSVIYNFFMGAKFIKQ